MLQRWSEGIFMYVNLYADAGLAMLPCAEALLPHAEAMLPRAEAMPPQIGHEKGTKNEKDG